MNIYLLLIFQLSALVYDKFFSLPFAVKTGEKEKKGEFYERKTEMNASENEVYDQKWCVFL